MGLPKDVLCLCLGRANDKECDPVGITGKRGLWDLLRPSDIMAHVPSVKGLNTDKCGRTQPLPKVRAAAFSACSLGPC